ncbi:hypothetical protein [Clostridium sardiniense]|uniref:hypothetical protein n=1 Tax=Clostridium sardiniense TaxID=29369 RepID=UPI00195D50CE|nr:hypothetical protein [Clostridium sardiniense]MBM7836478.1 hypothetical protein [Clostridium sardiniense]
MARRKCKCQICGKQLTTDIAFKLFNGKRNLYYCDSVEYEIYSEEKEKDKRNKDELYANICDILGYKSVNSQLWKEMISLNKLYSWEEMNGLLKDKMDSIAQLILENDIEKEYNKIRYIFGALSRDIHDYSEEQKKIKNKKLQIKTDIKEINEEIEEVNPEYSFKAKTITDFSNLF